MKNWKIDPVKKDYVMSGGSPVETESLTIPAYIRLKVKRTQWLYAPDDNYGSDFYLVQKQQTILAPAGLEAIGSKALQPIVDDGRAKSIDITADQIARHGVSLQTVIVDADSQQEQVKFNQLGV